MKSEEILMALGDVDERYVEESAPKKKNSALKWGTLAAGLLLVCGIAVHLLYPPSFETFLARYEKGYYRESSGYELNALMGIGIPVGNHFAFYLNVPHVKQSTLEHYIGKVYAEYENGIWYYIKDKDTLAYLISKEKDDGTLYLWKFDSFSRGFRNHDGTLIDVYEEQFEHLNLDWELDTCTYEPIFSSIYGLERIEDIEKIIVKPSDVRDSDTLELIWKDFEEKTLTDRESIQMLYTLLCDTVAYRNYGKEANRFLYRFSEENGGYGPPCGICELSIILKDGTVIDLIRYDANVGAFQHSGTYSALLSEEAVHALNEIFGIE